MHSGDRLAMSEGYLVRGHGLHGHAGHASTRDGLEARHAVAQHAGAALRTEPYLLSVGGQGGTMADAGLRGLT